jgi:hypothetical protein
MKILVAILLCGCGILFAAGTICQNPICGHPKWTHSKGGACAYDTCTHYQNR